MSGKKRILQISHQYFNRAGVEEHIRDLESSLQESFDFYVAFPQEKKIRVYHQGKVFFEAEVGEELGLFAPLHRDRFSEVFQKLYEVVKPDFIHVQHFYRWPLDILDQVVDLDCPHLISHHDYYAITPIFTMQGAAHIEEAHSPDYSKKVFGSDLTPYLKKRFQKIKESFARFDLHIAPSHYLQNFMEEAFSISVTKITHGIKPFSVETSSSDKLRFGYIGSLLPQKGWEILVHAFSEFISKNSNVELHIFGGNPLGGQNQEGVIFHGPYERDNLPQILKLFDIGIIPSIFAETFCYTLSELWMGKKPVAVSKIGALQERVIDGVNGKFFVPGDPDSIQAVMSWYLKNDSWKAWTLSVPRPLEEMAEDYRKIYLGLSPTLLRCSRSEVK